MQKILGGQIYGWEYGQNPEAQIGKITSWEDHDFLLVDNRWLGEAGAGLYDLKDKDKADAVEVERLYGPREKWHKSQPSTLYDPWGSNTLK